MPSLSLDKVERKERERERNRRENGREEKRATSYPGGVGARKGQQQQQSALSKDSYIKAEEK